MMRIQHLATMAKNVRDLDNVVLSLRLRGPEAVRFWAVMDKAKERNAYADRTDVLRELLELNPPEVLTDKDIAFFRTGIKAGNTRIEDDPNPHKPITDDPELQLTTPASGKRRKSG